MDRTQTYDWEHKLYIRYPRIKKSIGESLALLFNQSYRMIVLILHVLLEILKAALEHRFNLTLGLLDIFWLASIH